MPFVRTSSSARSLKRTRSKKSEHPGRDQEPGQEKQVAVSRFPVTETCSQFPFYIYPDGAFFY